MKTDWNLIREMMAAAIDSCEQLEQAGYDETHRALTIPSANIRTTVHDVIVSAYTYPESLRYQIIRDRHIKAADAPYVSDYARILNAMAAACAEMIGGADAKPAEMQIRGMIDWYGNVAVPYARSAILQE
jgi:hypothetical protein